MISSAFTALLNCAEVGRRNRILTNDRFLSHSLECKHILKLSAVRKVLETIVFLALGSFETLGSKLIEHGLRNVSKR